MRLWSLHPRYLDRQGLLGVWREALLAQAVLQGGTRGYQHHPQLIRFRFHLDPSGAIGAYLLGIADEGQRRGYRLDRSKILTFRPVDSIPVTQGQLLYEWAHLLRKLEFRDAARWNNLKDISMPEPHPLLRIVPGEIEPWERPLGL
jgi:hypothetical protein